MSLSHTCPLCNSTAGFYRQFAHLDYFNCQKCQAIFKDAKHHLPSHHELERYQLHHNDPQDPDYRNFVSPLTNQVLQGFTPSQIGLDYGCGPGPVAAIVLREKDYTVKLYDPFFYNLPENLKGPYDFIICCEVMEHFFNPAKEFERLHSLLKPGGALIAKTSRISPDIRADFDDWYYKEDPTHVFFYSDRTLQYIQQHFGFSKLDLYPTHFVFWK